jgi:NADH-quinone oxidoreductase subunit J
MEPHGLFYQFHFYLFGLIAVASSLVFVTRKSPVAAALWLVSALFALAALYIMMDAQFIGAIQVLVYAGAIMVVFLFVVMLLNLGHPPDVSDIRGRWGKLAAGGIGLGLLAEILALQGQRLPRPPRPEQAVTGVINVVADPLFAADRYLLAFEVTSVLLLAAIVGAVVLAKRRV